MRASLLAKFAWLSQGLIAAALSGCTQPASPFPQETMAVTPSQAVITAQATPYFPIPSDYHCDQDLILEWPVIEEVTPQPAAPGSTIEIVGRGGAIRCGTAYDESSRDFEVYLDDTPIGKINCYVNHCEGAIDLPENLAPGVHFLSIGAEGHFELQVQ